MEKPQLIIDIYISVPCILQNVQKYSVGFGVDTSGCIEHCFVNGKNKIPY